MSVQSKTALQTTINSQITTNGAGSITGAQVNAILDNMVDSYEDFIVTYTYANLLLIASPTTGQKALVSDFPNSENRTLFIYNGTYWKPWCGSVVLDVNATQTGTPASTVETTLNTYTLPASYLLRDLDYIEVKVSGQFDADNDDKVIKFYFGASTVTKTVTGASSNSKYWQVYFKIIRTGSATQVITGYLDARPRSGGVASVLGEGAKAAGSETMSGAIIIKVTGTNTAATLNDILCDEWTVTLHRK